eukprot:Gb_02036 [translate_table: standard]
MSCVRGGVFGKLMSSGTDTNKGRVRRHCRREPDNDRVADIIEGQAVEGVAKVTNIIVRGGDHRHHQGRRSKANIIDEEQSQTDTDMPCGEPISSDKRKLTTI